ncbi:hypothetical protein NDU88_005052 [Pleurodeles waltl]|uniref:Uncharacterized protein n=1 Tax=Pleurodeles waltl TaxID=8319 RepID=A0AAV7T9D1_PLEWA|nr:hypothetical protein NDU88_005052 [Pleurodeles waltl]
MLASDWQCPRRERRPEAKPRALRELASVVEPENSTSDANPPRVIGSCRQDHEGWVRQLNVRYRQLQHLGPNISLPEVGGPGWGSPREGLQGVQRLSLPLQVGSVSPARIQNRGSEQCWNYVHAAGCLGAPRRRERQWRTVVCSLMQSSELEELHVEGSPCDIYHTRGARPLSQWRGHRQQWRLGTLLHPLSGEEQ